jgi:hypothetical protein
MADIHRRLEAIRSSALRPFVERVREAAARLKAFAARARREDEEYLHAGARAFAFSLCRCYAASLLLEHADWAVEAEQNERGIMIAERWCRQELAPLLDPSGAHRHASTCLGIDGDDSRGQEHDGGGFARNNNRLATSPVDFADTK